MNIISKSMHQGEHIGYKIDDEGLEYEVGVTGLYAEDIMIALTKAGYKYLDYEGNIINPAGVSIIELVESTVDESELQFIYDQDDSALSEAEATKYFSVEVIQEELQEFRKEASYIINTRSELLKYLDLQSNLYHLNKNIMDLTPINKIAHPDTLFTIEEYRSDEEVKRYLEIMERMRTFSTYGRYLEMLSVLRKEGVLTSDNPTQAEVLEAYLAWGIPGMNLETAKWTIRANDKSDIKVTLTKTEAMAKLGIGLTDLDGNIHYRGVVYDVEDDEYSTPDVVPADEAEYYRVYNNRNGRESEFVPIRVKHVPRTDKIMSRVRDEQGYRYSFKADFNEFVIRDTSGALAIMIDMFKVMTYDGKEVDLSNFRDEEEYKKNAVFKAYAKTIIKEKTKEPLHKTSYEVCRAAGLSSYTALRFISYQAGNKDYSKELGIDFNTIGSADKYREGIPYQLLEMLDIDQEEVEEYSQLELIDLVSAKYIQSTMDGSDTDIPNVYVELIQKLRLVSSIISGEVNIGQTALGNSLDSTSTEYEIITLIESTVYANRDKETTSATDVINILLNDKEELSYDVRKSIRMRNNKYNKTLRDLAELRATRIKQSTQLCYIVRSFREMTNGDIGEERDFLLEMFTLDKKRGTLGHSTLEAIREAVELGIKESEFGKGFSEREYEMKGDTVQTMLDDTYDVATTMLFKEVLSAKEDPVAKQVDIKYAGFPVTVELSSKLLADCRKLAFDLEIKYSTLLDFVNLEITSSNVFCHYAINADVTPWTVHTRDGFRDISRYSFAVNYISESDIATLFGANYAARVKEKGVKVSTLREMTGKDLLIPPLNSVLADEVFEINMAEMGLRDIVEEESVISYFNRFSSHNNKAKESGGYAIAVPLKSDVCLSSFAELDGVLVREEVEIEPVMVDKLDAFNTFRQYDVINSSYNRQALDMTRYYTEFKVDTDYSKMVRYTGLLFGMDKPKVLTTISPSGVAVMSGRSMKEFKFPLTNEDLNTLEELNVAYRIGADQYIIQSGERYYELNR